MLALLHALHRLLHAAVAAVPLTAWRALGSWRTLFALTRHSDAHVALWATELSATLLGVHELPRSTIATLSVLECAVL